MCRLYGFRATEPTKVECTLAYAQNALLAQSRSDLRGEHHSDGWGIATYRSGLLSVERRTTAAHEDLHFSRAAERIHATTVLAHVRQATVGALSLANTHPFTHGVWSFAHNGTVREFDRVGARIEEETPARFREHIRGDTDSERVFYWVLAKLDAAGVDPERGGGALATLRDVVGTAVETLDEWCREARAEKPARLNFILTDGGALVATRWNHTLHWVLRERVHDCEICGIPHVDHTGGAEYRAVVIASEPISSESWSEVPDRGVITVDGALEPQVQPIRP